VDSV